MAYTTPRTWITNENVSAAMMNAQVSGNISYVFDLARTKTINLPAISFEEPTYKGTAYKWVVPASLNGGEIIAVEAGVSTAGTAGTVSMQIERVRAGGTVSVLSTTAKIDATELTSYTGTSGVVNASYKGLATGDWLNVVVVDHGGGTASANAGQYGLFAIIVAVVP